MKTGILQQSSLTLLLVVLLGSFSPELFSPTRSTFPDINPPKPVALEQSTTPTPPPSPSPPATAAPAKTAGAAGAVAGSTANGAGARGFGVAAGMASWPAAALASRLDTMKALGVTWVRFDLEWSNIQYQGPGQFDWTDYDRVVAAVRARGLNALGILDYTPDWARRGDCAGNMACAPADPAAYAAFAAAAAAHYKAQGMHAWEIWNEPNNAQYFAPAADPGAYAALLKAAYPAIHDADPAATVVTGGLSPAASSGGNYSPVDFMAGMYAAGVHGFFDALGDHPYTWPYAPGGYAPGGAWDQMVAIHGQMAAHGDGGKKIWLTEYGAPTSGPGSVSEAAQASLAAAAVEAESSYSWTGPMFWYSWQDGSGSAEDIENFFGLVRADGSTKPAFAAYQSAITGH